MSRPIYHGLPLLVLCAVSVTLACDPRIWKHNCTNQPVERVCATFEYTFPNECVMRSHLCSLAKHGFHFVKQRRVIDSCCYPLVPDMDSPVCADDGKFYSNHWEMDWVACERRDVLNIVSDESTCQDKPRGADYYEFYGIEHLKKN